MKSFFKTYRSNTYAGTCNQHCFFGKEDEVHTGRIFYKITHGGRYRYSFLFSNIVDGTYSNGDVSHRNMLGEPWTVHAMRVLRAAPDAIGLAFTGEEDAARINAAAEDICSVTFRGEAKKEVAPGEFFCTDPVELSFKADEYLCLEITFSGTRIPYMEELLIPAYRRTGDTWSYNKRMPCPSMVGCDRPVTARVGYIGDSITEGIGPAPNSYMHWNAQLSRLIGPAYSYWNLGIGCARANDIATDSAWLYKAKQNDIVFVCCGTNDTWRGYPADGMMRDIETVVDALTAAGCKVILQTIPPFVYKAECAARWAEVNDYIRNVLSKKVALVFDVGACQSDPDCPHVNRFGGHPNEEGCTVWAEALYKAVTAAGIF